jgi:hypothetical protein
MKENGKYKEVLVLLETNKAQEANDLFESFDFEESAEYFLTKEKLEQKFQRWSNAVNTYTKVLEMDPGNEEAKNNLIIIREILNFYNPEMFNP